MSFVGVAPDHFEYFSPKNKIGMHFSGMVTAFPAASIMSESAPSLKKASSAHRLLPRPYYFHSCVTQSGK